jgi:hypothetical protein
LIAEPQSVPYSLPVHDDLIVLPEGDVAWLTAATGDTAVRLVTVAGS